MRTRATGEMIFTLDEFRKLNIPELCRRYNWGKEGEWLDAARNEQAERKVLSGTAAKV